MGTGWEIEWNFKKQIINMSVRANSCFIERDSTKFYITVLRIERETAARDS
eukprot:SAG31_NODE_339_length_17487_cov_20.764435_3_plen_51_part_00